MSSIFPLNSLFVLFPLAQITYALARLWANKVDEQDITWKTALLRMFIFTLVVAILYFVFISVCNVVLNNNVNKDSIMMTIGVTLMAIGLLFDFLVDALTGNRVDKSQFIHPPKSTTKKGEYLYPPKSTNRMIEK